MEYDGIDCHTCKGSVKSFNIQPDSGGDAGLRKAEKRREENGASSGDAYWSFPLHPHQRRRPFSFAAQIEHYFLLSLSQLSRPEHWCARVGGVEIPNNKRVEFSLQSIYGIGRTHGRQILFDLNMPNKVTKDLSEEELTALRDEVSKYMIEGELRQFNARAIQRLKEIQCYRGIRHIQGLPCRGQHTRNNCRTLKGKRIPVAGKKKATR